MTNARAPRLGLLLFTILATGCGIDESAPLIGEQTSELLFVNETSDNYGRLTAAGDFNRDGYQDLAVGAPGESCPSGVRCGAVYLYFGSPQGLYRWRTLTQTNLDVDEAWDEFGYAVAAGDFNNDGWDDLAVGAPGEVTSAGPGGAVFLYFGGVSGLSPSRVLDQSPLSLNEAGDQFGFTLAAGDVTGDGLEDLLVGAPGEVWRGLSSGVVFAFRGVTSTSLVTSWTSLDGTGFPATMPANNDRFGQAIAVGDIVGDPSRLRDVVVGSPNQDQAAGAVFVFRALGTSFAKHARIDRAALGRHQPSEYFGFSLAIGDTDRSAPDDLVVGAPGEASFQGAAYLYRGGSASVRLDDPANTQRLSAADFGVSSSYVGYSVAVADITANGRGDVLVGAPNHMTARGAIFLFRGRLPVILYPALVPDRIFDHSALVTPASGDFFGGALTLGNFDGDVFTDLVVSAYYDHPIGEGAGAVYLYNGGGALPWHALSQESTSPPPTTYRRLTVGWWSTLLCRQPCVMSDSFLLARVEGARAGLNALTTWFGDDVDRPIDIHLSTDEVCRRMSPNIVGQSFYDAWRGRYVVCLWEIDDRDLGLPHDEAWARNLTNQVLLVHEYFHQVLYRLRGFVDEAFVRSLSHVIAGRTPTLCDTYFASFGPHLLYDLCRNNRVDMAQQQAIFRDARSLWAAGGGAGGVPAGQSLPAVTPTQLFNIVRSYSVGDPRPAFDQAVLEGGWGW